MFNLQTSIIICSVVFLVLLVLLERLHSIKIIIRLTLSLGIIYGYIRAIAEGKSIILFSILVTAILAVINIFIKNGIHRKSFSEILSVFCTTAITSTIVFFICKSTSPKIYQDEIMSFNGLKNPENAMFGIFMLATLGIYMDIISRIIYRLDEQKDKTVDTPWKEQFKEGIELGKRYITDKTNLIVLILLSVCLFPICANINQGMNFWNVFKQPNIFAYTLVAIVANIGLVLTVPITAVIYACLNRKKTIYKTTSENKVDGKRSLKL